MPLSPTEMVIASAGVLVSGVGTLVGVGGGFLMVPILSLGCGVPIHQAVGASLAAIFPAAFLSTVLNLRRGTVELGVALPLEAAAVVAAVGGAHVAHLVPGPWLKRVFGVMVGALGLRLVHQLRVDAAAGAPADDPDAAAAAEDSAEDSREDPAPSLLNRFPPFLACSREGRRVEVSAPGVFTVGGVAGFLAGLLGIGGGFLKTPSLIHVFGLPARTAAATSLATVMVTAGVGAVSHYRLGHLEPRLGAILMSSFLVGALLANLGDRRVGERSRRRLIAFSLVLAGGAMLLSRG